MGLIFSFVKKKGPSPNDFFTPHFSCFGHPLPTVSYCSKLCADKFIETMLLSFDSLKKCSKWITRAKDISNLVFKYPRSPSSGGIEY